MRSIRFVLLTVIVVAFFVLSSSVPAHADPAVLTKPLVIGQIGGATNAIAFDAERGDLFFSIGARVARVAVSGANPTQPSLPPLYGSILPGVPEDIKLANGFLYAALGRGGIAILDPVKLTPIRVEELPADALGNNFGFELFASDIAVTTQHLYVAAGRAGILVYNLGPEGTSLTLLQVKTFASPVRNITDVAIEQPTAGNGLRRTLYASANNAAVDPALRGGVMKFDITDAPTLGTPNAYRDQIEVNALATATSHVYAAGETALFVLDPTNLTIENGAFPLGHAPIDVTLDAQEDVLYLTNAVGIDVVNIQTPAAPVALTGSPVATAGAPLRLIPRHFNGLDDIYLFIADYDAGLTIARSPDTSPGTITVVSPGYVAPQLPIGRSVAASRAQAFAAGPTPLIVTVNSQRPISLQYEGAGTTTSSGLSDMAVYDTWLFAAAGASGLLRYAINAGQEPTDFESFTTGGTASDLAVNWPNVVVADGMHGLVIVNADGPLSLTGLAAAPQFNSNFRSVDAVGNYAYVVDANGTFRVYDLTDPTGPIALGTLAVPGMLDVRVRGNYAYLACGENGLRVVDVSDPNAPALVGTQFFEVDGLAQQLDFYQDYLMVAATQGGVHMLAIQPDGQLLLTRTIELPGDTNRIDISDNEYLYGAVGDGGLVMVQFNDFQVFMPLLRYRLPPQRYLPQIFR